jgi:hypothetical protein
MNEHCGIVGGPFRRGISGNPGGRPKEIARSRRSSALARPGGNRDAGGDHDEPREPAGGPSSRGKPHRRSCYGKPKETVEATVRGADCLALLWFARALHGMALRAVPAVGLMLLSFAIAAGQQLTVRFSQERLTGYRQHVSNAVGQPVPAGLPSRLRRAQQYWLSNPEARFRNLAAVARDRADILAACCDRLSGTGQERAALGRVRYLELASRVESRAELYGDRRASARVQRLQQLRRSGVYRGASAWDFTRAALMKDTMLGVALRPLLA